MFQKNHLDIKLNFCYLYLMSKSVHNPHDKFVRETFSDPERASAFIEEFFPVKIVKELDLSHLKVSQDSYLDNEMREYFSDLILKIPVKT